MKVVPVSDAWGNEFYYSYGKIGERGDWKEEDFFIGSTGPDGIKNSTDDIVFSYGAFIRLSAKARQYKSVANFLKYIKQ